MRIRLFWLVAVMASWAWPTEAQACSCSSDPWNPDIPTALRLARADAVAIYRARILSVEPHSELGGTATVEVLEGFKGEVRPGDRLELSAGGGDLCLLDFEAGAEYLMYAHGNGPTSVGLCSRTRPVSERDAELLWLRTGRLPPTPVPVALQRESVSCEPCDMDRIGGRLIVAPGEKPAAWEWPEKAEAAMKAGRPFLTLAPPGSDSNENHRVMVGMSFDGKPFELTAPMDYSVSEKCTRKVQLRWCKRLDVIPGASPRFRCVEPGEASTPCDEVQNRKTSWGPLEALPPESACFSRRRAPGEATCELEDEPRTLPWWASRRPVLICRPQPARGRIGVHECRVEPKPRPTSQAR